MWEGERKDSERGLCGALISFEFGVFLGTSVKGTGLRHGVLQHWTMAVRLGTRDGVNGVRLRSVGCTLFFFFAESSRWKCRCGLRIAEAIRMGIDVSGLKSPLLLFGRMKNLVRYKSQRACDIHAHPHAIVT